MSSSTRNAGNRRRHWRAAVCAAGALLFALVASDAGVASAPSMWFVATAGSDANSCSSPTESCGTIAAAVAKAASGDSIRVASGTYTGTGDEVVLLSKDLRLEGGWNTEFTSRTGVSSIDGQGLRRGVRVANAAARIERFIIENGSSSLFNQGGGILVGGPAGASGVSLILDESTVRASSGGIWSEGPLTVANSTVSGNTSNNTGSGGGITAAFGARLTITNSTISGNSAPEGGGVLVQAPLTGRTSVRFSNVTIVGNSAWGGGGVRVQHGSDLYLRNSIVAGNEATGGNVGWSDISVDVDATVVSEGYNLGTGFTPAAGDVVSSDPVVDELANNGGPTQTHALLGGPALDGGNPAGCSDADGAALSRDQRGLPRPTGPRCDIGAFETAPPANDHFAAAQQLNGDSGWLMGTTLAATKEPGEPHHAGDEGGASVWYAWSPGFTGWALFDTAGSTFDNEMTSRVCFQVSAGTRYMIAVDGKGGEAGTVVFEWLADGCGPPPTNDDFAAPQSLDGLTSPISGTSRNATSEQGEPGHGPSVWYTWTPACTGSAFVDTDGSTFDTLLGVYTGTMVSALTRVAFNDDARGDLTSRVSFSASAGTTYRIAVGGFAGETGDIRLSWGVSVCAPPPRSAVQPPATPPPPQPTTQPPVTPPPPPPAIRPRAKPRCVVPNVKGKTVARARKLLSTRRCRLGRVGRAYSRKMKRGKVIFQSRRPGLRLARGTRVNVVVSRGSRG
jgi:Right handed beta helix region/PASTA domain